MYFIKKVSFIKLKNLRIFFFIFIYIRHVMTFYIIINKNIIFIKQLLFLLLEY